MGTSVQKDDDDRVVIDDGGRGDADGEREGDECGDARPLCDQSQREPGVLQHHEALRTLSRKAALTSFPGPPSRVYKARATPLATRPMRRLRRADRRRR